MKVGNDLPATAVILKYFSGIDAEGERATVQRTSAADYAQYRNVDHPKAYGWWEFPLDTFKEVQ